MLMTNPNPPPLVLCFPDSDMREGKTLLECRTTGVRLVFSHWVGKTHVAITRFPARYSRLGKSDKDEIISRVALYAGWQVVQK